MKNVQRHLVHLLSPGALGLSGAAAVLATGAGTGIAGWLAAIALALWGLAASWHSARAQRAARGATDHYVASRQQFGERLAPIWAAQIESSRVQTEAAVTALAISFAGVVNRLDQAMTASSAATDTVEGDSGLVAVFANSEQQLGAVVATLQNAMASQAAMLDTVKGLDQFIAELKEMAVGVASISAQTNLLALNAAVVAAQAGPAGRSFAVVANEVRSLSNQSADTGRQISEKVAVISAAIIATRNAVERSMREETASMAGAGDTIGAVLAQFKSVTDALLQSTDILKHESVGIKAEVSDALVQLQFQDRVSQILCHVKQNIESLPAFLSGNRQQYEHDGALAALDAGALLGELEKTYATSEERAIHGANASTFIQRNT